MKKLIALILAAALLAGCQLASLEKNESVMEDKLVGVFVTFDYLDLHFDIEGYLNDNANVLSGGGEVVIGPGEGTAYQGKLYAEVGETGWEFPGYEGLIMGQRWREDHWAGFSTEGFCEMKTHVNQTDTLDGIEEEGTIYVPRDTKEFIFYSNPVYMTPEGEYYAVQGNGFSSGNSEIGGMSQYISDERTWTEDGVEYTYSAKYTTRIEGVDIADRVTVIHMSADHEELGRAVFLPETMPQTLEPMDGTAYLIVEESAAGEISRTLNQPGDDAICVYTRTEQVYALPRYTEVAWSE